jgi:hypothetical protein
MATYYLSSLTKEQRWKQLRGRIFWGVGFLTCWLISFPLARTISARNPNGSSDKLSIFLSTPLLVLGVLALKGAATHYRSFKKRYQFEIRVDEQGILRRAVDLEDLLLAHSEILGFTEHKNGALVIRTSERQRSIYAPSDTEDLSGLQQELLALNIHRIESPRANWLRSGALLAGFLLPMGILGFAADKLILTVGGIFFACFLAYWYIETRKNPNAPNKRALPVYVVLCLLFAIARVAMAWH